MLTLLISLLFAQPEVYNAKLLYCKDGDTCNFQASNQMLKVRLQGVDAPEINQTHGKKSLDYTETKLKGMDIELNCSGSAFDRKICIAYIITYDEDKKPVKTDFNIDFIRLGHAHELTKFSKGAYANQQQEAKSKRAGLWAEKKVLSPYCFKQLQVKKPNKNCKKNVLYIPN